MVVVVSWDIRDYSGFFCFDFIEWKLGNMGGEMRGRKSGEGKMGGEGGRSG